MSNPDSKSSIPAIVTTDLSSTPSLSPLPDRHDAQHEASQEHGALSSPAALRSHPSGSHLSPLDVPSPAARVSLDGLSPYTPTLAPGSPSPSIVSSTDTHVPPPSPTLSTRSLVHFAASTTLALRDNRPEERSGMSSLNLLSPHSAYQHRRKGSVASSMDGSAEGTEPDSHNIILQPLTPQHTGGDASTIASPTQTHYDAASDADATTMREPSRSRSKFGDDTRSAKGQEVDGDDEPEERPVLDLTQDEHIDPGVFPVKPYKLASLVDPKNLDLLKQLGGARGVLKSLGTSSKRGLGKDALRHADGASPPHPSSSKDGRPGAGGEVGAGTGASQRHDRQPETAASEVPKLVLTAPGDEDGGGVSIGDSGSDPDPDDDEDGPTYHADLEERRRVFGANVLPTRKTKTLLQLMWLALKDKVLVRSLSSRFRNPV